MTFALRLLLLTAGCATIAAPAAGAEEPTLLQRVGPATLSSPSVTKDASTLAFTDVLDLTVQVEGGEDLEVQAPTAWAKGPWQARPAAAADQKKAGPKTVWTQALRVEPLQPGELMLALEPLRYRAADGAWQTVTWKPIAIHVTKKLTQPDLKDARDITAIEELPALPPRESHTGLGIAAGGIAAALVILLTWWLRWRHAMRIRPSPDAWALYELKRLATLQLPEHGKHERFGTLLTGLLRRYLEKRFDLPARRQTTAEFLAALAGHSELTPHREFLEQFLRRCDLLKFAPIESSSDECRALAAQVSQFISQHQRPTATSAAPGAP